MRNGFGRKSAQTLSDDVSRNPLPLPLAHPSRVLQTETEIPWALLATKLAAFFLSACNDSAISCLRL